MSPPARAEAGADEGNGAGLEPEGLAGSDSETDEAGDSNPSRRPPDHWASKILD